MKCKWFAGARTPNFKAWFGDWENDAKNASKVVDANGEPIAVYHGLETKREIHQSSIPFYLLDYFGAGAYITQ